MKKIPMRSCVMCREKVEKRELLRIVRNTEGKIEFDPTGKKNGRGVYLCRKENCIQSVKNRQKITNSLEISPTQEEMNDVFDKITIFLQRESLKREGK